MRADIKETLKSTLLALCGGNSPVTSEFPAETASNAEKVSIWWRHHGSIIKRPAPMTIHVAEAVRATLIKYSDVVYQENHYGDNVAV